MTTRENTGNPRRRPTSVAALPSSSELARVARFIGNGLFNTLLSYVLFVVMLKVGLPVFIALLLSTGSTIIFNFFTSRRLVFRSKKRGSMLRFVIVYNLLFILNYLVLLALKACGVPSWLAQAAVVLPIAALAYAAQRNLIFNEVPTSTKASTGFSRMPSVPNPSIDL